MRGTRGAAADSASPCCPLPGHGGPGGMHHFGWPSTRVSLGCSVLWAMGQDSHHGPTPTSCRVGLEPRGVTGPSQVNVPQAGCPSWSTVPTYPDPWAYIARCPDHTHSQHPLRGPRPAALGWVPQGSSSCSWLGGCWPGCPVPAPSPDTRETRWSLLVGTGRCSRADWAQVLGLTLHRGHSLVCFAGTTA